MPPTVPRSGGLKTLFGFLILLCQICGHAFISYCRFPISDFLAAAIIKKTLPM
jgi:hypothetical protein